MFPGNEYEDPAEESQEVLVPIVHAAVHEGNTHRREHIAALYSNELSPDFAWKEVCMLPEPRAFGPPEEVRSLLGIPKGDHVRRGAYIEVMGFPETGKSSFTAFVSNLLRGRLHVIDEDQTLGNYPEALMFKQVLNNMGLLNEGIRNSLIAYYKSLAVQRATRWRLTQDLFNVAAKGYGGEVFTPTLQIRGPNDTLALGLRLHHAFYGTGSELSPEFANVLWQAVPYLSDINAVALFYLDDPDMEIVGARRVRAGKPRFGNLTHPAYWPFVNLGYSGWLANVFPYLRQEFGTGLITIDGSQNLGRNNRRLQKFIEDVEKLAEKKTPPKRRY